MNQDTSDESIRVRRADSHLSTPPVDLTEAPSTLGEALKAAAASERSATRGLRFVDLNEAEEFVSWQRVVEGAAKTARGLQLAGVERGDRVALFYSTQPEFFDAFFGALLAGAVPTPLYPPVRLGKMQEYDRRTVKMLAAATPTLALTEGRVSRLLGGVKAGYQPVLGFRRLDQLPEGPNTERGGGLVDGSTDDLALVQFSSGTTLEPKPVALSHRALLHQASILAGHWPDTDEQEQSGVSWLPLYHDMGLIGCVVPALLRVANLWLIPPELFLARPALWLRTLSRSGASVSPAPNFAYSLCVDRIKDRELVDVDLSRWRAALNGAEAVSMSTAKAFSKRFSRVGFRLSAMTPVYGLAEAALAVTFSDLEGPVRAERFSLSELTRGRAILVGEIQDATERSDAIELVSVGVPVPGFSLEVRDEQGKVCEQGIEGEVFVAGPSLLTGYLQPDGSVASALKDGWLATGDLGFVFDDELFLTSRSKDVLVLRGRNFSPVPLEELVSEEEGIRTGCAVAVSGLVSGAGPNSDLDQETEQLWIVAESRAPKQDHQSIKESIRKRLRSSFGLGVARVLLVEPGEIPRTSSGKLRRAAALNLARAGALRSAGSKSRIEKLKDRPWVAAGLALLHSRRADDRSGD